MFIYRFLLFVILFFISCNQNPKSKDTNKETKEKINQSVVENATDVMNDDQNCDINRIAFTKKNIEILTQEDILEFLKALKSDCENNAEFSQFSNRVLFILIDNKTNELLNSINDNMESLEFTYIIKMISNPVSDQFDLKEIKAKIKSSKSDESLKLQILQAISGSD